MSSIPPPIEPSRSRTSLRRHGRNAWAVLGIAGVLVGLWLIVSHLMVVAVPLVLAIFPATLLVPLAGWLKKRGAPATVSALLTVGASVLLIGGIVAAMGTMVASGIPQIAQSASGGLARLEELLQQFSPQINLSGWSDVVSMARERLSGEGEMPGQLLRLTSNAFEFFTGTVLLLVILFFYVKDGRKMAEGVIGTLPLSHPDRVMHTAEEAWSSLAAFFRGQLLVALGDTVLIGIGLLLLSVPLALPLAVLIFFGSLFPIIGALVTGAVAVLVALSDGGLSQGLIVLGIVFAVQQLEGNVMAPYILGEAIGLHPLVILLSVAAGGILLGVLGAFLAVPVATVVRVVWNARQRYSLA